MKNNSILSLQKEIRNIGICSVSLNVLIWDFLFRKCRIELCYGRKVSETSIKLKVLQVHDRRQNLEKEEML